MILQNMIVKDLVASFSRKEKDRMLALAKANPGSLTPLDAEIVVEIINTTNFIRKPWWKLW